MTDEELLQCKYDFFHKITPECHWFSNIDTYYKETFEQLAHIAGLSYEIVYPAFNGDGEFVPDHYGIFVLDIDYKNGRLDKYFLALELFIKKYRKHLEDEGYDMTIFNTFKGEFFLGCEKYYNLPKIEKHIEEDLLL